jgi:hypothetical protein
MRCATSTTRTRPVAITGWPQSGPPEGLIVVPGGSSSARRSTISSGL